MPSLFHRLSQQSFMGMITCANGAHSVAELMSDAHEIKASYPQLYNRKIALNYINLAEFVTALIAFDGWCSAIYLCPPDAPIPKGDMIKWPADNSLVMTHVAEEEQGSISTNIIQTNWYMATSGTTGEPKWFSHSLSSLTASIKHSHTLQTLCWALLYQPFRFAGLQVVLQALLSGADVVDATGCTPLALTQLMQQNKVTAASATPSLWRQLLMTGQLRELPLRHITLGGEIADQSVLDQLKRVFPQAKIRHIYASTETGVGFVVSDGRAGFPVKWLDDPALPVALKVSDKQHLMVKPRYELCSSLGKLIDAQHYVDTQDQVHIEDERVLFLGRATGIINVGGNKVLPEKVEQVLLQCADVTQAKVYAKKNPLIGQLVVADIVAVDGADQKIIKKDILNTCKNQLQPYEIPRKISVVSDIEYAPSGKINRKQQHD